ncbi:gluconokinase [Paraflavitalea sp. CAU 1676]|uniref:gluconokinase n=1 Tax=Paraflavitalea sp. CAU 1676 TaxID=3032598 RepID=UPI0023DAC4DA|nr:gluconokinase [Paraflavitalea sp. CAU 1676]MDF2190125.1 gluconokinase [Paraflavitalea sp. CAU 1676]
MSTKHSQYLIGVDIGTTNTKAIAFGLDGAILAASNITYMPLPAAEAGAHELDPHTLFNAVIETVRQVVAQTQAATLTGIAFSSAMHSLIAVDKAGLPLTNVITWADLRSNRQADALKATEAGKRIYQRTGTPIHPMSPLCKLIWLRETQPELFGSAHKFIGIKEYIFHKLLGKYYIDHSIASATGLFDIYELDWNAEALAVAGVGPDRLSRPVSPLSVLKGIDLSYATQLGIDPATPVIPGGSDGCLAQLGSGALQPGDVSLTIGTSGAVRMMGNRPQHDPQARIFNYILAENYYVSGGPINNGGVLLKWYAEHFLGRTFQDTEDFDWFVQQAAQAPAGADGLIFLPYVQGERAPVWDAAAKGMFFGIQARHTQAHFMRAIVEGVNFALYQVAQSLEETIAPMQHVYASGGFTKSNQWLQWLTDLFGRPVTVPTTGDASATGAAIVGFKALGLIGQLQFAGNHVSEATTFLPNESHRPAYLYNYEIYSSLYQRLKDLFHRPNNQ